MASLSWRHLFSSLRIASYKNFLRLHFDKDGRLEVFAFGVDKMPHRWCRYETHCMTSHHATHGLLSLTCYCCCVQRPKVERRDGATRFARAELAVVQVDPSKLLEAIGDQGGQYAAHGF